MCLTVYINPFQYKVPYHICKALNFKGKIKNFLEHFITLICLDNGHVKNTVANIKTCL